MYALKTLSDLQQSLADRHDNGVVPANSTILSRYTRLLNRGIEYCADQMRVSKSVTIVVTAGAGDFPDDFIIANSVFNSSGIELTKVDKDDQSVHTGLVFWVTGNQTDGFVLHVPTDGSYTANYSFKPTWLSASSDVCIIPDIEAPVAYAYALLRRSESDPFEDADKSIQECDARIAEMNSQISVNNDAIGFTMDFETATRPTWFSEL